LGTGLLDTGLLAIAQESQGALLDCFKLVFDDFSADYLVAGLFDQALDKVPAEVVLEGSGVAYGQYRDLKMGFSFLAVLLYASTHACLLSLAHCRLTTGSGAQLCVHL
jgi:hypothetical protein